MVLEFDAILGYLLRTEGDMQFPQERDSPYYPPNQRLSNLL